MKKLRLELDELAVESFNVEKDEAFRPGTVKGNDISLACETDDEYWCRESAHDPCGPSWEVECWWTTNPQVDCLPSYGVTGCPTG